MENVTKKGGRMSETIVQTKFQKKLSKLAKISFWTWVATIIVFVGLVAFVQNPDNIKAMPVWLFLGNIGIGVMAFIVAVLSRFVSTPRPLEETKSIYTTLSIGVGGLALLIILGLISPHNGSVSGARTYGSPLPDITLTRNKTTTNTPMPSTTPSQQYKPRTTQIDCIGPDNKMFKTTPEACAKFRTDWGLPASATPWPNNQAQLRQNSSDGNNVISCTTVYGTYRLSPSDCSYWQTQHSIWKSNNEAFKREIDANFTTLNANSQQALNGIANQTFSPMPSLAPITVSPMPTISPPTPTPNCYWKVNDYGAQFYYCQ